MQISTLGSSWISSLYLLNGIKALHAERVWLWSHNYWVFGVMWGITAVYSIVKFIDQKSFKAFVPMVLLPIWIGFLAKQVDVTFDKPAGAQSISAVITQAQSRVDADKTALAQAQKSGVGIDAASKELGSAESELKNLTKMQSSTSGVVTHAPAAFEAVYDLEGFLWFNFWRVFDATSFTNVTVQSRQVQSYLNKMLASSPQLTPTEKAVADQTATCLAKKQDYVQQVGETAQEIKKGIDPDPTRTTPRKGKALTAAWASLLAPTRKAEFQACHDLSSQLKAALDKSITPAQVKQFEGGFTIDGHSFLKTSKADKIQYLAAQMGVPASKVQSMSTDQIAKAYLRYRELNAVSQRLQEDLGKVGSSAGGAAGVAVKTASSHVASWLTEYLGDFLVSVKSWIQDTQNLALFILPIAFYPMSLLSLLPGQFKRMAKTYLFGATFVFSWIVVTLMITKITASIEMQRVAMVQPASGLHYVGQLVDESFANDAGPAEGGVIMAAGGTGRVLATKAGQQAAKAVLTTLDAASDVAMPLAVASVVATGAYDAASVAHAVNKKQAAFAKTIEAGSGINPALEALEGGELKQQREQISTAQDRVNTDSAIWFIASPLLAMALAFGSFLGLGQAAGSQLVQQAAGGVGSRVLGGASSGIEAAGNKLGGRGNA